MALDPLPHATERADGSLLIPKVTFDYMKTALADFEERFADPELHGDLMTVRELQTLLRGMKTLPHGDVIMSEQVRRYLSRCMHDFMVTFRAKGPSDLETTRASLSAALGLPEGAEPIEGRDEALAHG